MLTTLFCTIILNTFYSHRNTVCNYYIYYIHKFKNFYLVTFSMLVWFSRIYYKNECFIVVRIILN